MRERHGWDDEFLRDLKRLFQSWRLLDGSLPSIPNARKRKVIEIVDIKIQKDANVSVKSQANNLSLAPCRVDWVIYSQRLLNAKQDLTKCYGVKFKSSWLFKYKRQWCYRAMVSWQDIY